MILIQLLRSFAPHSATIENLTAKNSLFENLIQISKIKETIPHKATLNSEHIYSDTVKTSENIIFNSKDNINDNEVPSKAKTFFDESELTSSNARIKDYLNYPNNNTAKTAEALDNNNERLSDEMEDKIDQSSDPKNLEVLLTCKVTDKSVQSEMNDLDDKVMSDENVMDDVYYEIDRLFNQLMAINLEIKDTTAR